MVQYGWTPLMRACYRPHNLDTVKLLIHHGAHLNDKDYVSLKIIILLNIDWLWNVSGWKNGSNTVQ